MTGHCGLAEPFPRCAFQSCSTLQIIGERRLRRGSSSAFVKAGRVATRFHSFITAGWKSPRGVRGVKEKQRKRHETKCMRSMIESSRGIRGVREVKSTRGVEDRGQRTEGEKRQK